MIKVNRKNPWVNRWVASIWDLYTSDPPVELLSGYRGTDTVASEPNTYWRMGSMGREIYCDESSFTNALILGSVQNNLTNNGFTVMFKLDTVEASGVVRYSTLGLKVAADGSATMTGSGGGVTTSTGVIKPDQWHIATCIAHNISGQDYSRFWLDGQYIGEDALSTHDTQAEVSLFREPNVLGMVGSICYFIEHSSWYQTGSLIWPTEGDIQALHHNPWQVFAPQRIYVPMTPPAIVEITEEGTTVIITDVNTTGTWQDGATGLVITGSGFV